MVKGVKRNIIEIKDTGNSCFEKIVFYISPNSSLSAAQTVKMATKEIERFSPNLEKNKSLRNIVSNKTKKRRIISLLVIGGIACLGLLLKIFVY
ncbi:MAG: hypothetical protein MJ080_05515 [Clostridia bacterium]|nr:hypothetical protein [Clostridia bacterium]